MPVTGVYLDDILSACTAIVTALTLPTPPAPATGWTILSRFVETMYDALPTDAYPAVLIVPGDEGEEPSGETFGDEMDYKYRVYVIPVARNNQDFTSNRNLYLSARQKIRGSALAGSPATSPPMLSALAPSVWDARMKPKSAFDRKLLRQFAAMATVFEYLSHEPRRTP